jgi:PAS domain S-box-containing protein
MTQSVGPSLADGEHRFRAIFDCSPDCIKLVDADGHLLDMNAAGLRMIGGHAEATLRDLEVGASTPGAEAPEPA